MLAASIAVLSGACSGDDDTSKQTAPGTGGAAGTAGAAGGGAGGTSGTAGVAGTGGAAGSAGSGGVGGDPVEFYRAPKSCAYQCPNAPVDCAEKTTGYVCQNLGPWNAIPHAAECAAFDGTYPTPQAGRCTASAPTGDAAKYAGPDPGALGGHVLPDGRITRPAGAYSIFTEADLQADITTGALAIPGTRWVVTLDAGSDVHGVRVVDVTLVGTGNPVASYVRLPRGEYINRGAAFIAPDLLLVAGDGKVRAFALDTSTGVLTRDEARDVVVTAGYLSAVSVSPDAQRLVASSTTDSLVRSVSVVPGTTFGQSLGEVDLGRSDSYGVFHDPFDATGGHAWVSLWRDKMLVEILIDAAGVPTRGRTITTAENPMDVAFLDARWMVASNGLGEVLTLVDRVAGTATSVPVDFDAGLRGLDLTGLAWDAASHRIYAALAGLNALAAYDVDLATSPPTFTTLGSLPTGWWPSAVIARPNGDLVITSMRGTGAGPIADPYPIGSSPQEAGQRAGIQVVTAPDTSTLTAGSDLVRQTIAVGAYSGAPQVTCPSGAAYDFPVPRTNTEGASPHIQHVFYIVRENKTFNALLGDLPGVNADPTYTMKVTATDMDRIWPNLRNLARQFAHSDNAYTDADASSQGHGWNVFARTTHYCETYALSDAYSLVGCGVSGVSRPPEGGVFDWLGAHTVPYAIFGEIVGGPRPVPVPNPADALYPGGPFQNIEYPDNEKACHLAGRARVLCNLPAFNFITFPNDHTVGASPDNPSAELMCATNDEATGMFIDALSHSPIWKDSLVIITEDDPQQGGESVDYHRVPLVMVSPWVKRGYVSKTHLSVSSAHKLFAHVFGIPYPNVQTANAALPLDAFSSTPDYTPFVYTPRQTQLECGKDSTRAERDLTESWDFVDVDEQPGLDAQVMRWMRGRQLQSLTPELEVDIARRAQARAAKAALRARGIEPPHDDDDD